MLQSVIIIPPQAPAPIRIELVDVPADGHGYTIDEGTPFRRQWLKVDNNVTMVTNADTVGSFSDYQDETNARHISMVGNTMILVNMVLTVHFCQLATPLTYKQYVLDFVEWSTAENITITNRLIVDETSPHWRLVEDFQII